MNHSEEAESCCCSIHIVQPPFCLKLIKEFPQAIKVFALPACDFSILGGRERHDLINQDGDGPLPSRHQSCVAGYDKAEPRVRIGDGLRGCHYLLTKLVQTEIHD